MAMQVLCGANMNSKQCSSCYHLAFLAYGFMIPSLECSMNTFRELFGRLYLKLENGSIYMASEITSTYRIRSIRRRTSNSSRS